jgi:hypothetical protein
VRALDNYGTWGAHYLRSLVTAYKYGHPLNFKDAVAAVALAAMPAVVDAQDRVVHTFASMSFAGKQSCDPAVKNTFLNPAGGCFSGGVRFHVKVAGHDAPMTMREIADYYEYTALHKVASVDISIKTDSGEFVPLVCVVAMNPAESRDPGNLVTLCTASTPYDQCNAYITPYHPVVYLEPDNRVLDHTELTCSYNWVFPADIIKTIERGVAEPLWRAVAVCADTEPLYNILLAVPRPVRAYFGTNFTICASLGYTEPGATALQHSFFSNHAAITAALEKSPSFASPGFVRVQSTVRHPVTHVVVDWNVV